MAKLSIKVASTSQTINVFIQDSSVTTGAGKTGLAFNTGSLIAYYALPLAAPVAITLATQTATGAYSSGGFVELDATHCPGLYRLDLPDAALASGRFVNVFLSGVANMAQTVLEIELTANNNQDAVRGGMTALPNAAANATGGLPTIIFGGTLTAGSNTTATLPSPAVATNSYNVGSVLTVVAGTGVGQDAAITAYVGATKVATLGTTLATALDNTSVVVLTPSGVVPITNYATSTDVASILAVNTTQLVESYASLGTVPTPAQIWFEIRALLAEVSTSSTTLTTKKVDGSTTAETFTLNSATTPTSITRAS